MNNQNVDTEALEQAAVALSRYISEVTECIHKMKDAAIDCSDNMGSDVISRRNIEELNDSLRRLEPAVREAAELRAVILDKKLEIEDL